VTEPTVRLARPDDAEAIADAHVRGWLTTYRGHVPDSILDGLSVERRTTFWRDTIRAETEAAAASPAVAASPGVAASLGVPATTAVAAAARTWVVEEAGRVCGFASSGPVRDQPGALAAAGEVFAIYLAPEARGRGLGRALFEHVVDDLRGRGFAPIVVWVFEANTATRRFYEAAGFQLDGTRQPVDFGEASLPEIRYRLG
jgi:L-amino acid N-acyltransferase YncA